MKTKLLILIISTFFFSCEDDSSDEGGSNDTSSISTESISGFSNSEAFTPETIQFEQDVVFGEEGYNFKLFFDTQICDEFQIIPDVSFFIESTTPLEAGAYNASGPFFLIRSDDGSNSISFFGADVIIDQVSDDEISGRVRGGDEDSVNSIEGSFTAQLCQQ